MKKTIKVNGDTIKLNTRSVTRNGNRLDYRTSVNECEYFYGTLTAQEAMDKSFSQYIKDKR